jgi:tetratricopeptide (TPR) repeat protein
MEDYIQEDEELDPDGTIAFQVYFAITKSNIQRESQSELRRLEDIYADEFDEIDIHNHLLAQSQRVRNGVGSESVLNLAYKATEKFETHPGALNHLAIIILERIEEGYVNTNSDNFPDSEEALLRYAENCVREAIEFESEYAIYHSTLGRVLSKLGRHSAARDAIQKAIKMEEREKKDGPIRISEYHKQLTEIDLMEQQEEFEKTKSKIEKAEERVKEFQTRTLEFLGFFAALLTIAVTSVSISTSFPFTDASRLILILIGGILVSFAGLGHMLPERAEKSKTRQVLVIAGLGIILILLGFSSNAIVELITEIP